MLHDPSASAPRPSPNGRGALAFTEVIRDQDYAPACRGQRGTESATVIRMTVTETPTRGGTVRGSLAPPKVDALPVAEMLAEIEAREFTSLPALGAQIGMGEQARKYAIRSGLIKPEPLAKRSDGYKVNRNEALTLLLAAALAVAAGVAIAVMLRGVRNSGLTGQAAAATLRTMTS